MRLLVKLLVLIVLLVVSPPLAIVALVLYGLWWFLLLPFRLVAFAVSTVLRVLLAVVRVPAWLIDKLL